MAHALLLTHHRAVGDTLVMTGLVRDIALTYPGQYSISVSTSAPDLWRHNPYVKDVLPRTRAEKLPHVKLDYGSGLRKESKKRAVHFVSYFHEDFRLKTGTTVPLHLPHPDLHLSPQERNTPLLNDRYWVVLSGGKSDFTAKVWGTTYWQQLVDLLRSVGIQVVQAGGTSKGDWHPPLDNVLNLVGHTNLRDMMRLLHHADGVICGVTMAMHMAAALEKPCVCIAGGRESWWWEAYVNENKGFGLASGKLRVPHRYLHTIGQLSCCQTQGCWKDRIYPPTTKRFSLCKQPKDLGSQKIPLCLDMIRPEHVMEAVLSYYEDRTLPPIGAPRSVIELKERAQRLVSPALAVSLRSEHPKMSETPPEMAQNAQNTAEMPKILPELAVVGTFERKGPVKAAATAPIIDKNPPPVAPKVTKLALVRKDLPVPVVTEKNEAILDHPIIGGRFTSFVLLYGNYPEMHRECLEALLKTVPKARRDLRVGSNQLCEASKAFIAELVAAGEVTKHYAHASNDRKYPVMREMFYDESHPITTNYLTWFDDDTIACQNHNWLYALAELIVRKHPEGYRMFGPKQIHAIAPAQLETFKRGSWYRGKSFFDKKGRPVPNGRFSLFATGSCWALETKAMREANIPDPRIGHNGGDYTIGAQLTQAGYAVHNFTHKKEHVFWSKYKRRGLSETHFGMGG